MFVLRNTLITELYMELPFNGLDVNVLVYLRIQK